MHSSTVKNDQLLTYQFFFRLSAMLIQTTSVSSTIASATGRWWTILKKIWMLRGESAPLIQDVPRLLKGQIHNEEGWKEARKEKNVQCIVIIDEINVSRLSVGWSFHVDCWISDVGAKQKPASKNVAAHAASENCSNWCVVIFSFLRFFMGMCNRSAN